MASKKQRVDAAKKRAKRTKIFAIVGCVLLVAIGAYEIPSMLAVLNKKPPPSTYDPGPNTGSPLPNVAAGAATGATTTGVATAPSGELVDTDAPLPSTDGQLVSFSVFESKNPFAPQVSTSQTVDNASAPTTASKQGADIPTVPAAAATTAPNSTAPGAGGTAPAPQTPPAGITSSTTSTTTTQVRAEATVAVSVNGQVSHVASQGTFPTGTPVFRLVSWTKDTAQIAIVGGSYQTGDPTLALQLGQPVTLENQTDGKRYRIELLSTG